MVSTSRAAIGLVLAACVLTGCPSGESRIIPPAPTAAPGSAQVYFYVAEATDPVLGTSGGRVSAYQLGSDGLLPAAPFASIDVVNPRRLLRHPTQPVLYAAGANQIFAFDITGGGLKPLCASGVFAPPCATEPRPGANPFDMTIAQSSTGGLVLYVSEAGNGQNIDIQTRLAAYPLDDDGGLPASASSQVQEFDSVRIESSAVVPGLEYIYIADTNAQVISRYMLDADGDLPQPATSPTPVGAPTPTPTPVETPAPTPSPTSVRGFGPGRMTAVTIPACPSPTPVPGLAPTMLYVVQQFQNRIAAWPVPTPDPDNAEIAGALAKDPSSESNTRGFYNAILIDPCATHIYGAAFNNGQIDFYQLDAATGNIIDSSQGSTFADTSQYPTGLAWVQYTPPGGELTRMILVSLGGANRVDAYAVAADGSIPERPFSSTGTIDGTFPADVAEYVP